MGAAKSIGARQGDFLAGKYLLEECLGVGGMGEVYRAQNVSLGRTVAVKLLSTEMTQNEDDVLRFLREARAAAAVRHPNVVDVIDILRDDDGAPFIVQELLSGQDLEQHLQASGGKLGVAEVLEIMIPVADAVYAAHARDVVHRDLKPANIFLAREGRKVVPKVLDFGAALYQTVGAVSAREQRMLIGTPHYMAPEQITTKTDVDARADVWAMGVILYELLVGETPFEAETANAVMRRVRTVEIPRLSTVAPDAPSALERLVTECTRRDKSRRPPDASVVRDALTSIAKAWRKGRGESSPELVVREEPASRRMPSARASVPPKRRGAALLTLSAPDEDTAPGRPAEASDRAPRAPTSTQRKIAARVPDLDDASQRSSRAPTKQPPPDSRREPEAVSIASADAEIELDLDLAPPPPTPVASPPPPFEPSGVRAALTPASTRTPESTRMPTPGSALRPALRVATPASAIRPERPSIPRILAFALGPAVVAAAALRFLPALTRPLGRAVRGESPVASGVLAVLTLVASAGLGAKSLSERSRALAVSTIASVALGILMIVVTFSASDMVELGIPSPSAVLVPFIGPIAPVALAIAALGRARASWGVRFEEREAAVWTAVAGALFLAALELSPIGAVLAR